MRDPSETCADLSPGQEPGLGSRSGPSAQRLRITTAGAEGGPPKGQGSRTTASGSRSSISRRRTKEEWPLGTATQWEELGGLGTQVFVGTDALLIPLSGTGSSIRSFAAISGSLPRALDDTLGVLAPNDDLTYESPPAISAELGPMWAASSARSARCLLRPALAVAPIGGAISQARRCTWSTPRHANRPQGEPRQDRPRLQSQTLPP